MSLCAGQRADELTRVSLNKAVEESVKFGHKIDNIMHALLPGGKNVK